MYRSFLISFDFLLEFFIMKSKSAEIVHQPVRAADFDHMLSNMQGVGSKMHVLSKTESVTIYIASLLFY